MSSVALDPDRSNAPAVLLLDVGQGDASLVVLPGTPRRAIVVDCNDDHVVHRHLVDFGVARLCAVVFTHLDLDHIRGGLALVRAWAGRLDRVYVASDGRLLDETTRQNDNAKRLFDALLDLEGRGERIGPTLLAPQRGIELATGEGWRVRLVAPFHGENLKQDRGGRRPTTNEHSAVVRIERDFPGGRRAILIGGDAPLSVWRDLPEADRTAEVFRIPHHGGALDDGGIPEGWSPSTLYEEVAPSEAVISVGTANDHGHPAPDWRSPMVERAGCRVRCTQVTRGCHPPTDDANERFRLREMVVSMLGQAEPAWRHLTARGTVTRDRTFREVPCAGTVTVALSADGGVHVRPLADAHEQVIAMWSHPWCKAPMLSSEQAPDAGEAIPDPLDAVLDELIGRPDQAAGDR